MEQWVPYSEKNIIEQFIDWIVLILVIILGFWLFGHVLNVVLYESPTTLQYDGDKLYLERKAPLIDRIS